MTELNPTAPQNNPLFAALAALASPEAWVTVTALPQTRPHRFRVELKRVNSEHTRQVELQLRSEREIADVWEEFNDWYLAAHAQPTLKRIQENCSRQM